MGTRRTYAWLALGLIPVAACAADDAAARGAYDAGPPAYYDSGTPSRDSGTIRPPPAEDGGVPPEVEEERDFETPRAGARHVYVANPLRDSVAVIDAETLRIESVEAGDGPTYLETAAGRDLAVVLNVGSDDATILRTGDRETTGSTVPVVPGTNAIAIAPDGRHAIVWVDATRSWGDLGTGSFQDVSVLTLDEAGDAVVDVSVGFRPSAVLFQPDGSAAFLVTEDGVSIVRFADVTGPTIVPTIPIGDDAFGQLSRDVSVTPDGRYALARRELESEVRLVDLATGEIRSLDLGGAVTDLDVETDGLTALAVVRDHATLYRLALPGAFDDPSTVERIEVPGEWIGAVSVSPDGRHALLYTTALPVERVTVVDLETGTPRTIRLRKAVRAITVAPSGGTALVVHTKELEEIPIPPAPSPPTDGDAGVPDAGSGTPPPPLDPVSAELEREIDRSWGYSLLDLESGFAKLQVTEEDVGPVVIVPDGSHAFALFRNDAAGIREVQRMVLGSFYVDRLVLGSPPLSLGVVGDTNRIFVGQEHPEGRITFIDWDTFASEAVTGFELNSRTVE